MQPKKADNGITLNCEYELNQKKLKLSHVQSKLIPKLISVRQEKNEH